MATQDDHYKIIFNGEIYNFRELRAELKARGVSFKSQSDTEVVLYAWKHWGPDAIEKLRGAFAFGLLDTRSSRLYCVRDRLGIKPLYFTSPSPGVFGFSSELRTLLDVPGISTDIDRAALPEYLATQSVSPPNTFLEDVRMLKPGHYLTVNEAGQYDSHQYWNAVESRQSSARTLSFGDAVEQTRERLEEAVSRRMVSDVPLGAFLSGGVDSSAVVGLMSEHADDPVRTVALAFEDEGFEDGHYARLVADRFRTDHTEVTLDESEARAYFVEALDSRDHPTKDGVNTFIVSKVARDQGLTVALSGVGGDEVFAGYPGFRHMMWLERLAPLLRRIPSRFRQRLFHLLTDERSPVRWSKAAHLLRDADNFPAIYSQLRRFLFDPQIEAVLEGKYQGSDPVRGPRAAVCNLLAGHEVDLNVVQKTSVAEMSTYLHNVLLRDTDQMSMAHSLEIRVPLLDHRLVEFAVGWGQHSIRNPKALLKAAVSDLLPEPVMDREKQGFRMPVGRWFRGPLRELGATAIQSLSARPHFNGPALRQLWKDFLAGRRNITASRILLLISLGRWWQAVLD